MLFHNFEVIVETFGVFAPEGALAKPEIPEKCPKRTDLRLPAH